jgi:phage gp45-like
VRHSSSRIAADRHANGMSRSVVEQVDDTKYWQQGTHSLFANEQQGTVEHVHPYGFTSVPQKPTGTGRLRQAAEAVFSFLGGNRSHGIAMLVGDRRYRLYKLDGGEVALHDDQGQQVHLKRDGIWASVPQSKSIKLQIMDDDTLPQDAASNAQIKNGQIKQAGRPAQINIVLDKNQFTVNHPNGTVNFNCANFNLNASGTAKLIAGSNILVRGVNAIMYATASVFLKAAVTINAKSVANLSDPPFDSGASDPPITG